MILDKEISKALHFAIEAHKGQTRSHGGAYVCHTIRVAERVSELTFGNSEAIIAALLHDTIEDTKITYVDIFNNFGANVANIVNALTTNKLNNDELLVNAAYWDDITRIIKLADIFDNVTEASVTWGKSRVHNYATAKINLIKHAFKDTDCGYDETLTLCQSVIL